MATKKRTRNASVAGASHPRRSTSKKTPAAKKRAAHGTSRSAAKATPTRSTSKRRTKGAAPRDPKPLPRAAKKAPARTAGKAHARAASKAPARNASKARTRAANKAPTRVAARTTRMTGTGRAAKKRPIVARNKGAAASAGGRRQSDVRRRDGAGHIDPKYAADLLAQGGTSDRNEDRGFVEQPRSGDDLAENLGEEFVASATSGENQEEEVLDQEVPEERGGPFVESPAGAEFGWGTDPSNPKDAKREPFPTT